MDEVTSSVDPVARRGLEDLARALARTGVVVVWVTHDLDQLRRIADHVVVVIDGRVAYESDVPGLDAAPAPVLAFLGAGAGDE
jgi:ABC-type phosphate transport system ATPase subunit